jgi:hypothetical protein
MPFKNTSSTKWYHGSLHKFDQFQTLSKAGVSKEVVEQPIFLTSDINFARDYAKLHGYVYEVQPHVTKTFNGHDLVNWNERYYYDWKTFPPLGKEVFDALLDNELWPDGEEHADSYFQALAERQWDATQSPEFVRWLKNNGYDSFLESGEGAENMGVFDPAKLEILSCTPVQQSPKSASSVTEGSRKTAAPALATMADIQSIVREFMRFLEPDLPLPQVKITNNTGSTWLGRDTWDPKTPDNTLIQLQKSILADERTLRRIIAHELCHHEDFLLNWATLTPQERVRRKRMGQTLGHGKSWQEIAARFNAAFGADFVTEKSDAATVIADVGNNYYMLVLENPPKSGRLIFSIAIKPSPKQIDRMERALRDTSDSPNELQARLFRISDPRFATGPKIGNGWGVPRGSDIETLRAVWENTPQVAPPEKKPVKSPEEQEQPQGMYVLVVLNSGNSYSNNQMSMAKIENPTDKEKSNAAFWARLENAKLFKVQDPRLQSLPNVGQGWVHFNSEEGGVSPETKELEGIAKDLWQNGTPVPTRVVRGKEALDWAKAPVNEVAPASKAALLQHKAAPAAATTPLTDTPAFKAWFGSSKVVDKVGKPLVLFHGSDQKFDTFEKREGLRGDGGIFQSTVRSPFFFFTPDADYAWDVAQHKSREGRVMRVYLKMENPLDLRTPTGMRSGDKIFGILADHEDETVQETRDALADLQEELAEEQKHVPSAFRRFVKRDSSGEVVAQGPREGNGYVAEDISLEQAHQWHDEALSDLRDQIAAAEKELESAIETADRPNNLWHALDEEDSAEKLKSAGYDGVIFHENEGSISYAVPDANQIKSVSNAGSFDPSNASVLASNKSKLLQRKAAPAAVTPAITLTPAFKRWFSGSKVVIKGGKPLPVYHGTTHDFDTFDANSGNEKGWYGSGIYFTNSSHDASENYAGVGPDLQGRIETETEELTYKLIDEKVQSGELEKDPEWNSPEYNDIQEEAKRQAEQKLKGEHQGAVMPCYLRITNPVVVDSKGGTRFEMDFDEETGDESGTGVKLWEAFTSHLADSDVDPQKLWSEATGDLDYHDFTAYEFEKALRSCNESADLEHGIGPWLAGVYREMGYDGIIMDANAAFPHMDMESNTKHFIVWNPTQVKSSIGNNGDFSDKNPSITARKKAKLLQAAPRAKKAPKIEEMSEAEVEAAIDKFWEGPYEQKIYTKLRKRQAELSEIRMGAYNEFETLVAEFYGDDYGKGLDRLDLETRIVTLAERYGWDMPGELR